MPNDVHVRSAIPVNCQTPLGWSCLGDETCRCRFDNYKTDRNIKFWFGQFARFSWIFENVADHLVPVWGIHKYGDAGRVRYNLHWTRQHHCFFKGQYSQRTVFTKDSGKMAYMWLAASLALFAFAVGVSCECHSL